MDDAVLRAMQKWPNVPAVYGWLALDRRGNWLIKNTSSKFDRITNSAMIDFIARNYASDDEGRWFLQNGPQRVFVTLEYTPWIYRLDDTGRQLMSHTGHLAQTFRGLYLDESSILLADTEIGAGVLHDRDLAPLLDHLKGPGGKDADSLFNAISDREQKCRFFGQNIILAPIRAADVPERFGFNPRPTPPPGQPDC